MTSGTPETIPRDTLRRIPVLNRQRQFKIYCKAVAHFCAALLESLNLPDVELSVVFVGSQEMRSVNDRYRGMDYATDVLSFAYDGVNVQGTCFIGEIIIAPEVAVRQATRYRVSPDKELRKLLVHGTLHLLGYDHETDKGLMNRLQAKLVRRRFFRTSPLLAELNAPR